MSVIYKVEHFDGEHDCMYTGCDELATHSILEFKTATGAVYSSYVCDKHTDEFNQHAREHGRELKK